MSNEKKPPEGGLLEMSTKNNSHTPVVEFKRHEPGPQGWSDWVQPKPMGYLIKCCDCGLVHEMDSKVVRYVSDDECEDANDANFAVIFRMRRFDEKSTNDQEPKQ